MKLLTVRVLFIALVLSLCSIAATAAAIDLPATGQTVCYDAAGGVIACDGTGQDGDVPRGAGWTADTRFNAPGNGTVTDNLTGLIWLLNANCFGAQTWANALTQSNNLASGSCGLTDGSTTGDWRLPNRKELMSLHDLSQSGPPLSAGYPFSSVQGNLYWSSDTLASDTARAWGVTMGQGSLGLNDKVNGFFVWPVRGDSVPVN